MIYNENQREVLLCAAKRTAVGSFGGSLAATSATELGSVVVRELMKTAAVPPEAIDEVVMGCVLQAGLGQAPARQVALKAGLPNTVQCATVNKVCSSGLYAVMLAARNIQLGISEAVIAGGMESMSQSPYLLPTLRNGARLGHTSAEDSIVKDGLWDVYNNYHMGNAAELCAREFKLDRAAQDTYTAESYGRANRAAQEGWFKEEIVGVTVKSGRSEWVLSADEEPAKFQPEKLSQLKPVFDKAGTVTAANASSLSDGAAAMLVCSEEFAKKHALTPLARVVEQGWAGRAPEWFTIAPVDALQCALDRAKKKLDDIELFEINEAFAAVALACQHKLNIDSAKLNICGGAVAIGHPIGASGARILTTLLYSLKRTGKRLGAVAICNGGGEATAMIVERV